MTVNRKLNIVLVGGESAGLQTLRLLTASPHRVVAVLATPAGSAKEPGLWNAAQKEGIRCIPADRIRLPEFAADLCHLEVDVLLNVHSLFLIPSEVLAACRVGAFNLHPGPLPEYAGLDVPSWALYHGETSHGVTLHEMVPEVDAGTIAYQTRFAIRDADTGLNVMSTCVRQGMTLVSTLLEDLYRNPDEVPRIPQDLKKRRYFYRRPPNDGRLSWNRSARQIVNHIRAADYSPFPSPWGHPVSLCGDSVVGFIRATLTGLSTSHEPGTVGTLTDTGVLVAAADQWINVELVMVENRKRKASDVLTEGTALKSHRSMESVSDHGLSRITVFGQEYMT